MDFVSYLIETLYGQRREHLVGYIFDVPVVYSPIIILRVLGNETVNACVISTMPGVVFVNDPFLESHPRIQRAIVAHEIGHMVNGDLHGAARLEGRHVEREIAADMVAVKMCGKDAVLAYLTKIRDTRITQRRRLGSWDKIPNDFKRSLLEVVTRIEAIRLTPEPVNG